MSDDIAVALRDISKMYRLFASPKHRMLEALHPFRKTYHRQFWALRNITVDIPRGRTVGILGVNGSGKSTLLQIVSSVLQPTTGAIQVNGRVAALLELGAGFNPELTGRENVVLNGTIMGLRIEQIQERMEEIRQFADIGEFFDQPMKTYSTGMFMRVAFATAVHVDPDLLIIDEAISVGDAKFQEKCFRRFRGFQRAGKTILFVTHDRLAIPRYCDLGLLLHQGELVEVGEPAKIAELYGQIITFGYVRKVEEGSPAPARSAPSATATLVAPSSLGTAAAAFCADASAEDRCPRNPTYNRNEVRSGNQQAEIVDYLILTGDQINPATLRSGAPVELYLKILFREAVENPIVGISFTNKEGVIGYAVNSDWMLVPTRPAAAGTVRVYRFTVTLSLGPTDWFATPAVAATSSEICDHRTAMIHLQLSDARKYEGLAALDAHFEDVDASAARVSGAAASRPET